MCASRSAPRTAAPPSRRSPLAAVRSRHFPLLLGLLALPAIGRAADGPLPRLVQKDGRHALLVDGAPYLILGAQVNNSSAWPAVMPQVWPAIKLIHANTVEMPVYWEQLEPQPGKFDYSAVEALVGQCRKNDVRLVLLWFGTWKNGSSHYMPLWMKQDPTRFPRLIGANGRPVDSPSPFSKETLEADKRAFVALMRHLKKIDPQRTVIMVQVENEAGTWGAIRDYSPAAQKAFESPVPAEVLSATNKKPARPGRQLRERWPHRQRAPHLEGRGARARHPGAGHLHGRPRQGSEDPRALPAPRQPAVRPRDFQRAGLCAVLLPGA